MSKNLKLNISGFNKLRTLPAVKQMLLERGRRVAEGAGPGYVARDASSKVRARVIVHPNTGDAEYDNAENNTLIRNMDRAK